MSSRRSRTSASCASAARTSCATSSFSGSSRPTASTVSARRPPAWRWGRGRPTARGGSMRSAWPAPPPRTLLAPEERMLDVEVLGTGLAPDGPPVEAVRRLCDLAAASVGVSEGHLAVEYVDAARIRSLNAEYRGEDRPTDVLSFPIDGAGPVSGPHGTGSPAAPRELGDVVICPEHTGDL